MGAESTPLTRSFPVWALLTPLGLGSVLFLYGAASLIPARYGLEYGEGLVLWQASRISAPSQAYHPISQNPYVVFNYPPVFHLASQLAGWATGDLLIGGRLVTFCSALAAMVGLAGLVCRSQAHLADGTARWIGALTAALLFAAALPNVHDWVPHMRVDMFGVALSVLSMWAFIEGRTRPWLRYVAFAGFTAAVFTKQTLVSAPLAALVVMAIDARKDALKLAVFAATLGLIPLIAMQFATHGEFATHLFFHNQNSYTVRRAFEMQAVNLIRTLPVLILAGVAIWLRFTERRQPGDNDAFTARCLLIYLASAFLMTFTAGKYGSTSSYFLEVDVLCCALAGIAVAKAVDRFTSLQPLIRATVGLLVVIAGSIWLPRIANTALQLSAGARALVAARQAETLEALRIVQAEPGPVLSWDLMVVMLAKNDLPLEPAIMFDLSRTGKWDIAPLIKEIRDRHYGLIVADANALWMTSEPVARAMADAYVPAERFGSYHLYRPRQRP